jgi:hypothetical protein
MRHGVSGFRALTGDLADSRHDKPLEMKKFGKPGFIPGWPETGNTGCA